MIIDFLKKLHKKTTSKKGMTLIEVVVASAVSCIILVAALGVIIPTTNTITYNKNVARAKDGASQMISQIKEIVKYGYTADAKVDGLAANGVFTDAMLATSPANSATIYRTYDSIEEKMILYSRYKADSKSAPILEKGKYRGIEYDVKFGEASGKLVVKINVYTDNAKHQLLYKIEEPITILNGGASAEADANYVAVVLKEVI